MLFAAHGFFARSSRLFSATDVVTAASVRLMVEPLQPAAPPRRLILFWTLLAALPVGYIALQAIIFSRNIVFWDEFDTALDLILNLHAGTDWRDVLQRLFAINNEHRMLTSRLMFAASYWLTGTVNFHVIGAIGNLFLVGACAILVCAVAGWQRRIRLGVVLAFLLFQLEHFENFLWSGASIDHFQVITLAVGALAAVARGSARALALGAVLAVLATFTLAHGTLVWPIAALLLVQQRRWNHVTAWIACTILAAAAFLYGFEFNAGHRIVEPAKHAATLVRYWLALLGGPLTLGDAGFAPAPGLLLLAGFGLLVARGAHQRQPVPFFAALFAIGSLALIAVGRAGLAGTADINSRYLILGALAWALFIFLLLELGADPVRPFRLLVCLLPALAAFNVAANAKFAPIAAGFIEVRDRAATSFMQYGADGRGVTRLHPVDGHADKLLQRAADTGVYALPEVSDFASFPDASPNPQIIAYVDEFVATERAITIGGWGMIPGRASKRGQAHILLKSANSTLVLTSVPFERSDVAAAYKEPKWRWSGFRTVIRPERLPAEDFDIGVLIADGDRAEFIMTPNRLLRSATPPRAVRLAPAP